MKKIFLSMFAVAGMLFANSCSQDELLNESNGDFVNASFAIGTTEVMGSRAIGEADNVDQVTCAVFDENGAEMTELRANREVVGGKATYNVRLAKGQSYRIAFFAYDKDANAYDVTDMKSIKVLGNQASNVDARDAFTNYIDIDATKTMNAINDTVKLYRPFAQLNLGIDDEELAAARMAGIVVTNTKIVVSNVYNEFSAFDNAVVETDAAEEMEFALNAIPTEKLKVTVDGVEKTYNYLALNYLLVGDKGAEKSLTDVEFIWATADGKTNNPTTSFINIPVQRNFRTNIVGKLLTNPAVFNIVVDAKFDGEKNVIYTDENGVNTAIAKDPVSLQEAIDAATEPGDYVIRLEDYANISRAAGDIVILQRENVNLVIDGCGSKFDGVITVNGNARAKGAEKLTLKGINFETTATGITFISAPSKINNKYNYSHNVTIEDCTFKGGETVGSASFTGTYNLVMKNCTATGMHSLLQAQSCDNTVYVENVKAVDCKNGVSFGNTANATLKNSEISAKEYGVRGDGNASRGNLVIENSTVSAIKPVIIRKLTTDSYNVKLNNADLTATGLYHVVFTKGSDDEAYVAPTGAYSIEGADNYNVYPRDENKPVFSVSNSEQLAEALANNKNVELTTDIKIDPANMSNAYGATGLNVKNGQSINGGGYTLDIKGAGGTWDSGINTTGGLIENIKVTGSFRGIFVNHNSTHSETVVLKNVILDGTTYTISCDQGMNQNLEAYNSTFNGWTSYAATIGEVKFTDCSFGYGNGYKFCRPYAPTEFVGCNFCEGYTVDPRAAVTFENCTINGVALTAENLSTLVTAANIANATVK